MAKRRSTSTRKSTTGKATTRRKATAKKSTPKKKSTTDSKAPLIVSISGIRGIAGLSFRAETIFPYVEAFAEMMKGKRVVLGHDARPSSRWVIPFIDGILTSHGIDVIKIGLCATPTLGLLVRKLKATGGINVTASHNPIEYNGLKFFHSAGEFFTAEMLSELKILADKRPAPQEVERVGKSEDWPDAAELHLETLIEAFPPPERRRASKAPKVILDCCNSAGAILAPDVSDAYGAVFQLINSDIKKLSFPRGAEPTPENITQLRRAVIKEEADIGFAIDPDADRLALVDELGRAIGEERTLVLAADAYMSIAKKKSPIVVNLSTSRAIEDVAKKHKVSLYRTAVGEANVLAGMKKHKARIGGEGNGGVIVPQVQPGRDTAVAIALILIGIQLRGGTLSEWNASIPDYVMKKTSVPLGGLSVSKALGKIKQSFRKEKIDTTDGVKVILSDSWLHVRASNTEPIVRIMAEAPTSEGVEELIERAKGILQ